MINILVCGTSLLKTGTVTHLILCKCMPKLFLLILKNGWFFHRQFYIILKTWNIYCKFIVFVNYWTSVMLIIFLVSGIMCVIYVPCFLIYFCDTICFLLSSMCSDALLFSSFNVFSSCILLIRMSCIFIKHKFLNLLILCVESSIQHQMSFQNH